ncbi:MAG: hypothetical protein NPINA01_19890 [Nitrospinaceae bacterium]|nr:MAG: hypothetical protein NPINA01_19890 [Nitrospinaceae bacterium]
MKPARKYLLIVSLAVSIGLGLLWFVANTKPNVEVIITNNSGQPISTIDLLTEKTGRKIRLHGVEVGTEVVVKFHSDSGDTVSTVIRFSDGREIRGERFYIEPGIRVLESVTEEKIIIETHRPENLKL